MQERLLVGTSLAFGGLGLLVAAVGLFGLLSYFVTSRKTEIGIRMALGAGRVSNIMAIHTRSSRLSGARMCRGSHSAVFLISKIFAGLFFRRSSSRCITTQLAFGLIFVVTLVSVLGTFPPGNFHRPAERTSHGINGRYDPSVDR